jgi:hypothetical protein
MLLILLLLLVLVLEPKATRLVRGKLRGPKEQKETAKQEGDKG